MNTPRHFNARPLALGIRKRHGRRDEKFITIWGALVDSLDVQVGDIVHVSSNRSRGHFTEQRCVGILERKNGHSAVLLTDMAYSAGPWIPADLEPPRPDREPVAARS